MVTRSSVGKGLAKLFNLNNQPSSSVMMVFFRFIDDGWVSVCIYMLCTVVVYVLYML